MAPHLPEVIIVAMSRRSAIALLASLEQFEALVLQEQLTAPEEKAAAARVARGLADIEPVLLTRADALARARHNQWLDAAEQSLAFYGSELRRLQDHAGVLLEDYQLASTRVH